LPGGSVTQALRATLLIGHARLGGTDFGSPRCGVFSATRTSSAYVATEQISAVRDHPGPKRRIEPVKLA
jgi:hypothetical protein